MCFLTLNQQILCDICGRILDLAGVTTQFPWRTAVVASGDNQNDSMLEEMCKTLSELEMRVYLEGISSEPDHVILTNDDDTDKELELLLSPSKSVDNHHKKDGLKNKTATQSLDHSFVDLEHHLRYGINDANTMATVSQIKVRLVCSVME